jgi:hypothetical protein
MNDVFIATIFGTLVLSSAGLYVMFGMGKAHKHQDK